MTLKPLANENSKYYTFQDFCKTVDTKIVLDDHADFQVFFNQIKAKTNYVEIRNQPQIRHNGENYLDSIEKNLHEKVQTIQIGNEKFSVKKNIFHRVFWYCSNGKKASRDNIVSYVWWLMLEPTYIEITDKRDIDKKQKDIDKMALSDKINQKLKQKDMNGLSSSVINFCKDTGQNFEVDFKGYEDMRAVSFIFKNENGFVKIYKASYENNDLNNEIECLQLVNDTDFILFCEKRYDKTY